MKRYIITWFNYILNRECVINLMAKDYDEATELAIKFMESEHLFHKYNKEHISTVTCLDDGIGFYTKDEIVEKYNDAMKKYASSIVG